MLNNCANTFHLQGPGKNEFPRMKYIGWGASGTVRKSSSRILMYFHAEGQFIFEIIVTNSSFGRITML